MDSHGESRCSVIVVIVTIIGMLSAALGFAAEATSPRLYEVQNQISRNCTYPKSPAQRLGPAAIILLVVFRFYCPIIRTSSPMARLSLMASWVAWLVAMSFYVVGMVMIFKQEEEIRYNGFQSYIVCHVVKPGIFGAGASFVLASIVLEIIYMVGTNRHDDKIIADSSTRDLSMVSTA